jgi:hypothetical protein
MSKFERPESLILTILSINPEIPPLKRTRENIYFKERSHG